MRSTFEVALLMEEIIKNADPASVLRRLLANTQKTEAIVSYQLTGNGNRVAATYLVPVTQAMAGVEGQPEEVVEWLRTGLTAQQTVIISKGIEWNPCFILTRYFDDRSLLAEMRELGERAIRET